ncbi:MAG: enoyl-CoA hydratase, partial [Actinobacteria bacterium]|nr:enoyl-CoA hydratase [Actinomycetota bacterium]
MYQELADAINEANGDFAIRAAIITSSSEHFTSGNDLFDFLNAPPLEESSPVMNFLSAIHNFSKPLLAAVSGNAVGIGTTMLLHCDVVIAAPTTKFSMPFVSLGLVPEAGSSLLFPRLVGHQRASKIFLAGEPFGTKEALEFGLIAKISEA